MIAMATASEKKHFQRTTLRQQKCDACGVTFWHTKRRSLCGCGDCLSKVRLKSGAEAWSGRATIECVWCLKEFTAKATAAFCCKKCSGAFKSYIANITRFEKPKKKKQRPFVSRSTHVKYCETCGKWKRRKDGTCGRCYWSKRQIERVWRRQGRHPSNQTCGRCGVAFSADGLVSLCRPCSKESERDSARAQGHKRRQRERAAKTSHRVGMRALIERDKGKCCKCGCKVKMGVNKNNGASIDHIIPLSKGGRHEWSNVQLLCRLCNSVKCATTSGQLRLNINWDECAPGH